MPKRALVEVAIRLLGLWSAFTAVTGLVDVAASCLITGWGTTPSFPRQLLLLSGVAAVVPGLLGAMLIGWAPWIAARFYPADPNDVQIHVNVGAGDVYHVACFVLGVYLLVHTTQPVCRLVAAGMTGAQSTWSRGQMAADAITAAVSLATGLVLVFGSQRISQFLSNLRYDPDTIPKQQVSLALLLLAILVFAVILGVIRAVTHGGF
jgi:hypothetical protein